MLKYKYRLQLFTILNKYEAFRYTKPPPDNNVTLYCVLCCLIQRKPKLVLFYHTDMDFRYVSAISICNYMMNKPLSIITVVYFTILWNTDKSISLIPAYRTEGFEFIKRHNTFNMDVVNMR